MRKIREYGGVAALMVGGGFIGILLEPVLFPVGQSYEVRKAENETHAQRQIAEMYKKMLETALHSKGCD